MITGGRKSAIEVYDMFSHNDISRAQFGSLPNYEPDSFHNLWEENTARHRDKIDLLNGDFRELAGTRHGNIEFLYVDIIKDESLLGPFCKHFLPNLLNICGVLFHQDYFHWQSPSVVYSTEYFADRFVRIGTLANNACVFVKEKDISKDEASIDWKNDIPIERKLELMDQAISNFSGVKAGLLKTSKLALSLSAPDFPVNSYADQIRSEYSYNGRILKYVSDILERREHLEHGVRVSIW